MQNVKSRMIWYMALLFIGIIIYISAEFFEVIDNFWSGIGICFVIVSIIRLIQIGRFKNDAEYAKKLTVKHSDERNHYLANRARSHTFYYSILVEGVTIILFNIMDMSEIAQVIGMVLCGQIIIYWITYFLLKSKY
ncbi:hypothetical protein E8M24_33105 [Bacillus thuringiensis]|uniref:hypothetical protein n=1 Tax=Bacillus thuringiensis TaxID=1428 RepID=UPI00125EA0BC|nr:hypothetical protein [Bacillus thuringiensis]KAB5621217.1 hypothetical protein E8M24_33105 [Bacillus thuringiensis]HDR5272238.1 hypothetical protein [Bacillus thuringiensis]